MLRPRRIIPTFATVSHKPVIHEPCGERMLTWRGGLVCASCYKLKEWAFDPFKGSMGAILKDIPFRDAFPNRAARRADSRASR